MIYSFNDWINLDTRPSAQINYYKASTGTTVDRGASNTDFDYFDDDFGVGDYLEFRSSNSGYNRPWESIKVYVGTPVQADTYEYVWEAYINFAWVDITPYITDPSNGLTVPGEHEITFRAIDIVQAGTTGGDWQIRIRLRVTNVVNPTEGGANSTQKVQVKNYRLTVDAEGVATTITLEDLYQTCISNGWDCIRKVGHCSYFLWYDLELKNGVTLDMTKCNVEVASYTSESYVFWESDSSSKFYAGEWDDTYKRGHGGVHLYFGAAGIRKTTLRIAAQAEFYGSIITARNQTYRIETTLPVILKDCLLRPGYGLFNFYELEVEKTSFADVRAVMFYPTGGTYYRKFDLPRGHYLSVGVRPLTANAHYFFEDCKWEYIPTQKGQIKFGGITPYNVHFRNMTLTDGYPIYLFSTDSRLWREYKVKLRVIDKNGNPIEGAEVRFYDQNGTERFLIDDDANQVSPYTDSNGEIEGWLAVELFYYTPTVWWYWNQTATEIFNPFTIIIKNGSQQVELTNITITENINGVVELKEGAPAEIILLPQGKLLEKDAGNDEYIMLG